jgi:hypothetical protein
MDALKLLIGLLNFLSEPVHILGYAGKTKSLQLFDLQAFKRF